MPLVAPVNQRVLDAREWLHAQTCPRDLTRDPHGASQCPLGVSPDTVGAALDHLDTSPRDARGVRRILHDAVCLSQCEGTDHADRTQASSAAALRRFRAQHNKSQAPGENGST